MHMPSLDTSRRIKSVTVPVHMLKAMLTQPQEGITLELENGLPITCGVVGGAFDHEHNNFVLFVADKSFEELGPGVKPPELPVNVRVVYGAESGS